MSFVEFETTKFSYTLLSDNQGSVLLKDLVLLTLMIFQQGYNEVNVIAG